MNNLIVTAELNSPLAGDAPYLDGVVEYEMARIEGKCLSLTRSDPAPIAGEIHLPLLRGAIGGVTQIPRCSAPIIAPEQIRHEHYAKRLAVEHADCLRDDQRLVVATGNSWTKAYRLPLKISNVAKVVWFVGGSKRKTLLSVLRKVHAIGQKRSQGYGRIAKWCAEEMEADYSWFAPSEHGTLLMRALPLCSQLPNDLIGYKRDFGACIPPMWHQERYMEVVVPC